MPQLPEVVSFGCRLNIYESEVVKNLATDAGLTDVVLVNTCAVTKEAERQAKQAIRKLKREHPNKKIFVTGCSAQLHPDSYDKMPEVDRIIGNDDKLKADTYKTDQRLTLSDIMEVRETSGHLLAGFDEKCRAFVQIQNGCDHRCTFCIIPFARGPSRSVPMGMLADEVRGLITQGYQEIILTGVDTTSYGHDLPGQPTLGQGVRRLLNLVPEIPRLRLSSLDPAEIDTDLLDLLANDARMMPHVHISLQAGDDMILKRMKRRHNRQDLIDFCARVRAVRPDVVFGADIIAGFPTETDEMFQNTARLVDELGLTFLHVFPYSPREGTPAAKMPQVALALRKERAKILREVGKKQLQAFFKTRQGQDESVLIERGNFGHTQHFAPVKITNHSDNQIGRIAKVRITGYDEDALMGEWL